MAEGSNFVELNIGRTHAALPPPTRDRGLHVMGLLFCNVLIGLVLCDGVLADHPTLAAEPSGGHGTMVDALGETLVAGPYPERIVSLSPNLTEFLFALGVAPERIVGVTRYCDFPPEVRERPSMGGIVDPSLERIQMARPNLVLAARGNPLESIQRIRALGISVFAVEDQSDLEGVSRLMGAITALVGPDDLERATQLERRFQETLRAFRDWSSSIPVEKRPRVYYMDAMNPEWTAGPGSHVDDLIQLAGGRNAVTKGKAWPQYSDEALVMVDPDWILLAETAGMQRAGVIASLRRSVAWRALRAPEEGNLCWIPADELLRPGPRILSALEKVAECLHPGASPGAGP